MDEIFLPVLSHFQNGNGWTASVGPLRWRATPEEETVTCQVWRGPWCYELGRVEARESFPLSEEGLAAMGEWVRMWGEKMAALPPETLAQALERRDAARGEGDQP